MIKRALARHPRKLAELRDLLAVEHIGDDLGIVGRKSPMYDFADLGAGLAHHGATAGDDSFRHGEAHAVVGAPVAKLSVIATLAVARTGLAVPIERAVEITAPC